MRAMLSTHAHLRIVKRTRMGKEEVLEIINDDSRHILLFQEDSWHLADHNPNCIPRRGWWRRDNKRKIRVLYKLFFSSADLTWFVVLQNKKTGIVITFLCAWFRINRKKITPAQLVAAFAATPKQITYQPSGR